MKGSLNYSLESKDAGTSKNQHRWAGPISVALFVPDVEFSIAETFIEYLRNCYPAVRKQVVMTK